MRSLLNCAPHLQYSADAGIPRSEEHTTIAGNHTVTKVLFFRAIVGANSFRGSVVSGPWPARGRPPLVPTMRLYGQHPSPADFHPLVDDHVESLAGRSAVASLRRW